MNRLVDDSGSVRCGIFARPIDEVNDADFRLTDPFGHPAGALRRHFAFNQFEFLGGLSEELVFGCAVANVRYAGTVFLYAYEPRVHRFHERSFRRPLGLGIAFDRRPEDGRTTFHAGADFVEMTGARNPPQRRLHARAGALSIDAVFSEADPPQEPMRICTPVANNGWVFARKTAGHRLSGELRLPERTFDLGAIGARGHHDWSAGFMRRETFWNWGCVAGTLPDGRVLGLNVSCGVNETSFTESCFWVDGRLQKIDAVRFDYDRRDVMLPWRLTSFDRRLDLRFRPETEHCERLNAWIVATDFHQLIGRYDGTLTTAADEHIAITNLLGYAEHHYAKW